MVFDSVCINFEYVNLDYEVGVFDLLVLKSFYDGEE